MGDQGLKFDIVVKKRDFGSEEDKDKVEGVAIDLSEDDEGKALHPLSSFAKIEEGEVSDNKPKEKQADPLANPLDDDPLMGGSSSSSSSLVHLDGTPRR